MESSSEKKRKGMPGKKQRIFSAAFLAVSCLLINTPGYAATVNTAAAKEIPASGSAPEKEELASGIISEATEKSVADYGTQIGPQLPGKTTQEKENVPTPTESLKTPVSTEKPASAEGPEPPPSTEGQGTLSPPSERQGGSVFGAASSGTAEPVTDEKMAALLSKIPASLPKGNGSWSVYVCDLVNHSEGNINEQRMQAASLIKLYIMGAVYENYETLTGQYGQSTMDSWLYSMVTVSDNDAANALVNALGGGDSVTGMSVVNAFCQAHGYTSTSMGRMLLQSNAQGDNYTSVTDCGHFLKAVYERDSAEFPYADAMFDLLADQTRRNKIPAQMPEGVHVANKTGELSNVENDAGILYDTENDLVLVFMSENLSQPGSAQSTIASVSRQIYDYYNQ